MINKRVNAKDKRRVLLTVSPAGQKVLADLVAIQAPVNDALFDTLSHEEFARLKEIMARLVPCASRALSLLAYLTQPQESAGA